jgi:DNA-binding transcriptional regulator LsrR (DeoR family)
VTRICAIFGAHRVTHFETLVRASRLYYELGETQEQIAEVLKITRSQVSRLLKEARAEGIVEIRINDRTSLDFETAEELRKRFDLRSVHLAPRIDGPEDLNRRMIGRLAASVLRDFVRDGVIVGVGGGGAVSAMIDTMTDMVVPVAATVIPLSGGGMSVPSRDPVRRLAEAIGGYAHELPAPGLVHDPVARNSLLGHVGLQNIVRLWEQLDIAVFGIGVHLRSEVWFGPDIIRELEAAGAVGEVLVAPFDIEGRFVSDTLRARTIGFDARDLPRVPLRIAIAGGDRKVQPVLGGLRSGVINVLVTDDATARSVLELDASIGPKRAHPASRPVPVLAPVRATRR